MTENAEVLATSAVEPAVETETKNPVDVMPEGTAPEGEEAKQAEPAKTFTQAEVDALVQKRLQKEERRVHRKIEQQMRDAQQQQIRQQAPARESFVDDEAYLRAHIEHLAEQKAAEKLAERQTRQEAEKRSESFLAKAEAASERYADFQAVVSNPDLPVNEAMAEFIAESDQGAEVAYYLGKHPSKAFEISQMSPMRAARELTRIESEVGAKSAVKTSSAPAPITPIGNRGAAPASLANMDFAEYKKQRLAMRPSWAR